MSARHAPPSALQLASTAVLESVAEYTTLSNLPSVTATTAHRSLDFAVDRIAAFVPFKESLLLSAYEPTKEAIYSLREYVTTTTKNGFRPPAAHMTEIANMLKFYEDARAVKQRKTEERNRAKQQAKAPAADVPAPPSDSEDSEDSKSVCEAVRPGSPTDEMDVDDSGSRSEIGTVPAGLCFKKTPVQVATCFYCTSPAHASALCPVKPILDSGANVTILSKDKDVIIIDDPIDAAPNKEAKAESRRKKAARRAEKEKEKEKAEVAPLVRASSGNHSALGAFSQTSSALASPSILILKPTSRSTGNTKDVSQSVIDSVSAILDNTEIISSDPDFLRKREKEITKDLVAAAYRMQYFYNLRNFFVERLADTRKQREGANLDRFLQDGDAVSVPQAFV
ncbi:hypothetical protein C8R46DRAFT_1212248 [Mycena filopes]|nr:hypothetical protein C8R46DRAFT_1212248 [Mycena filopes]